MYILNLYEKLNFSEDQKVSIKLSISLFDYQIQSINTLINFSTGTTNWKCFAEIKSENVGADKPEYFTTKATVLFLRKENCMYQVCFP